MSAVAADVLEVLLEADPHMKISMEDEETILLDFTPETKISIVLHCPIQNAVNRVTKAMMCLTHRMVFCHHSCTHMSTKCAVETMGIWAGLRMVLSLEQMKRLEGILRRHYPAAKIDLC